jgi:hypothetical protein
MIYWQDGKAKKIFNVIDQTFSKITGISKGGHFAAALPSKMTFILSFPHDFSGHVSGHCRGNPGFYLD